MESDKTWSKQINRYFTEKHMVTVQRETTELRTRYIRMYLLINSKRPVICETKS